MWSQWLKLGGEGRRGERLLKEWFGEFALFVRHDHFEEDLEDILLSPYVPLSKEKIDIAIRKFEASAMWEQFWSEIKKAMGALRFIDRVNFTDATIFEEEYRFLVDYIRKNKVKTVLEIGPGASTYAFLEADCDIVTLEFNKHFREWAEITFGCFDNVTIHSYDNIRDIRVPQIEGKKFDIAFVDSPPAVTAKYFARLYTCLFASRHTDTILLHNAHRDSEMNTLRLFEEIGWDIKYIYPPVRGVSTIGIAILKRGNNDRLGFLYR